jgi:hypothetical protein
MYFNIKAKTFTEYAKLANYIANKDAQKDNETTGIIKISAYPKVLDLDAHGGYASITIRIDQSEGYEYNGGGNVCVQAEELVNALKSFLPSDELFVSLGNNRLSLSPTTDIDNYIKITSHSDCMILPDIPDIYDQQVTVDREYFVKGLQEIKYAPARKYFDSYKCVFFESVNNTLKFTAGSGPRFAIVEYIGNDRVISSGNRKIFIPKINIPNIIRIFKTAVSPMLDIRISLENSNNNAPQQYIINAGNITLRIYSLVHFRFHPDTNTITAFNYPYQVTTKIQDWICAANSLSGNKYSLTENTNNTKVMINYLQGHISLQNTSMNMNKKITFESDEYSDDGTTGKDQIPWFCCNACHLIEMAKINKKIKIVTICFKNQPEVDDLNMNPEVVLFRFPDELKNNGVTKKSSVFFVVSKIWDDKCLPKEPEFMQSRYEILDL